MKKGTLLRTAMADAMGTAMGGGTFKIYTGAIPADPDSASVDTLLATIVLPAPAFAAAAAGVAAKTGSWSGSVVADGNAGWGRLASNDGSLTLDVTVGLAAADAIIDDDSLVTGGIVTVNSFTFTVAQ